MSTLPSLGGLSEPAKYERLVEQVPEVWWSDSGPFAGLHELNVIRVEYFRRAFAGFRGKRVLDIGCGGGILSESLAREGAIVTGIDPSERSVRAAREHARQSDLRIDYRILSAERLDPREFAPGFDLVLAVDVLEHVDDLDRTLAQVAAMLVPGGGFGFLTHNRTPAAFLDLVWDEEYVRHSMPQGFHEFARFIPPAELTERLTRHDIRVCDVKGVARVDGGRALVDDVTITYIGWGRKAG